MADFAWNAILKPADAKLSYVAYNTSGGTTFDGSEQIVGNTPGRLKLELAKIYLSSATQINAWKALEFAVRGRASTILMPVYDYPRAPWPVNPATGALLTTPAAVAAFNRAYPGAASYPGASFTDTSGTSQLVINAVTVGDTAEGTTATVIQMNGGGPLQPGQFFEDNNEHVYCVLWINSVAGNIYSVAIQPPVRADIPSGTQLNFDDPKLSCRMEADDSMVIKGGFTLWRTAIAGLTFWEDVLS